MLPTQSLKLSMLVYVYMYVGGDVYVRVYHCLYIFYV